MARDPLRWLAAATRVQRRRVEKLESEVEMLRWSLSDQMRRESPNSARSKVFAEHGRQQAGDKKRLPCIPEVFAEHGRLNENQPYCGVWPPRGTQSKRILPTSFSLDASHCRATDVSPPHGMQTDNSQISVKNSCDPSDDAAVLALCKSQSNSLADGYSSAGDDVPQSDSSDCAKQFMPFTLSGDLPPDFPSVTPYSDSPLHVGTVVIDCESETADVVSSSNPYGTQRAALSAAVAGGPTSRTDYVAKPSSVNLSVKQVPKILTEVTEPVKNLKVVAAKAVKKAVHAEHDEKLVEQYVEDAKVSEIRKAAKTEGGLNPIEEFNKPVTAEAAEKFETASLNRRTTRPAELEESCRKEVASMQDTRLDSSLDACEYYDEGFDLSDLVEKGVHLVEETVCHEKLLKALAHMHSHGDGERVDEGELQEVLANMRSQEDEEGIESHAPIGKTFVEDLDVEVPEVQHVHACVTRQVPVEKVAEVTKSVPIVNGTAAHQHQYQQEEQDKDKDEDEQLLDLPMEIKKADPYWAAKIKRVINGELFTGHVEDIEMGSFSKEWLYRIRYHDNDLEHFTLEQVRSMLDKEAQDEEPAALPKRVRTWKPDPMLPCYPPFDPSFWWIDKPDHVRVYIEVPDLQFVSQESFSFSSSNKAFYLAVNSPCGSYSLILDDLYSDIKSCALAKRRQRQVPDDVACFTLSKVKREPWVWLHRHALCEHPPVLSF